MLRVSLRRIRARPRRSGKPKAKVATHAAGARAEVSKLKPEPAVHTHAAAAFLADGEVAHRVGGRVDAALAKPVAKRRGSVRPLDATLLAARAPPVALRPRHGRVGRRDVSAVRQVGRREGLTAVRRGVVGLRLLDGSGERVSVGGGDGPRDGLGPRLGHRAARRGRGDLADALLGLSGLRLW